MMLDNPSQRLIAGVIFRLLAVDGIDSAMQLFECLIRITRAIDQIVGHATKCVKRRSRFTNFPR
jgi:hypothetical protein